MKNDVQDGLYCAMERAWDTRTPTVNHFTFTFTLLHRGLSYKQHISGKSVPISYLAIQVMEAEIEGGQK